MGWVVSSVEWRLRRAVGLPNAVEPNWEVHTDIEPVFQLLEAHPRWLAVDVALAQTEQYSAMWHLSRVQPTAGDAIAVLTRWWGIVTDTTQWHDAEDALVMTGVQDREGARRHAEFDLVDVACAGPLIVGYPTPIAGLRIPWLDAAEVEVLSHRVGLPVRTDGSPAVLLVPGARARPLLASDPTMARFLEEKLVRMERAVRPGRSITDRVRDHLYATLPSGDAPDRARVARALGRSERSFLRHLAAEGTTWQALLDEVRADLARRWLPTHSVAEVAERLGYADGRSFARAWRRWTGEAPKRGRR